MAAFKCEKCDREFKNDRALKVHVGMAHKDKRKGKKKAPRAGKFVCKVCGRSFGMAMHLARHVTAAHGTKHRREVRGKKAFGAAAGVPRGLDVGALSIDQLLDVKKAVDARLIGIAQKMRYLKLRG